MLLKAYNFTMTGVLNTGIGHSRDASWGSNAFKLDIPPMSEILKNVAVAPFIEKTLHKVIDHLGVSTDQRNFAVKSLLSLAQNATSLVEYEQKGHRILADAGVVAAIPIKLSDRASLIHSQIVPWVIGHKICDLGCGDGNVGKQIAADGKEVILADVYQHPHIASTGLPFQKLEQGKSVPLPNRSVDTTLLLTVLHHADDPVALLREGVRITRPGGRVILIESVFGISSSQATAVGAHEFGLLTSEEQRLANIFFDHLYNRVIHYSATPSNKVNVPFNFNTPERWGDILAQCGAPQQQCIHLGEDQKSVPEYHTLHVGLVS